MKTTENFTMNECSHIYDNHIAATNEVLKDRLINGNFDNFRYSGIKVDISSKFINEKIATKCINLILKKNSEEIIAWTNDRCDKRLILKQNFVTPVGHGFAKHTNFRNSYHLYGCIVILELGYNGQNFNVVTSYPIPNKAVMTTIEQDRKIYLQNKRNLFCK